MNSKPCGPFSVPTNMIANNLKLCSMKRPRHRPSLEYLAIIYHVKTFSEFKESEIS